MPYQIRPQAYFDYLAAGAQSLGTVPAQQTLLLGQQSLTGIGLATSSTTLAAIQVPGGETPSQANFNTAIDALAAALKTAVAANLAQLQGFATGGG